MFSISLVRFSKEEDFEIWDIDPFPSWLHDKSRLVSFAIYCDRANGWISINRNGPSDRVVSYTEVSQVSKGRKLGKNACRRSVPPSILQSSTFRLERFTKWDICCISFMRTNLTTPSRSVLSVDGSIRRRLISNIARDRSICSISWNTLCSDLNRLKKFSSVNLVALGFINRSRFLISVLIIAENIFDK